MTTKRKKIVLTIKQKLELIERFEKGESTTELAQDYGIGVQTVRDIRKNKTKFEEFVGDCESIAGPSKRKTMKKSTFEDLDFALLQWFRQKRAAGIAVTGPECIDQAKLLHEVLGLGGNFTASTGWLTRFKQRYGIRGLSGQRNTVQDDEEMNTPLVEVVYDTGPSSQDPKCLIENCTTTVETIYTPVKDSAQNDNKFIDHIVAMSSIDNLLEYMNQWDFSYNDVITVMKIRSEIQKKIEAS